MKDLIRRAYRYLREKFPPNRVVALLTPVVAPLAGYVATWVAEHFPGLPPIDETWLAAVFVAGTVAAVAAAYKWLDGWQSYEADIRFAVENERERESGEGAALGRVRR